jgi:hypothetical protein
LGNIYCVTFDFNNEIFLWSVKGIGKNLKKFVPKRASANANKIYVATNLLASREGVRVFFDNALTRGVVTTTIAGRAPWVAADLRGLTEERVVARARGAFVSVSPVDRRLPMERPTPAEEFREFSRVSVGFSVCGSREAKRSADELTLL